MIEFIRNLFKKPDYVDFFGVQLSIPEGFMFITMDRDGELTLHTKRPIFDCNCWYSNEDSESLVYVNPETVGVPCENAIKDLTAQC